MGSFQSNNNSVIGDFSITGGTLTLSSTTTTTFTGDNANATIPITHALAKIDPDGTRSGMRFAGGGVVGQIIVVINVGGESTTFHNTEGTCLVRGINSNKDTIRSGEAHIFVSDGSLWNHVGGGATDEEMTAG